MQSHLISSLRLFRLCEHINLEMMLRADSETQGGKLAYPPVGTGEGFSSAFSPQNGNLKEQFHMSSPAIIDIPAVCHQIRHWCEDDRYTYKACKQDLYHQVQALAMGLRPALELSDLQAVIQLHQSLFALKGRKASFAEEEIARGVLEKLPMAIFMNMDEETKAQDEAIDLKTEPSPSSQSLPVQMCAELAAHAVRICNSPAEKSKRYQKRLVQGIRLLNELQHYYLLLGAKDIYWPKVESQDQDVQFFALDSLAGYYMQHETSLTPSEQAVLRGIIDSTDHRYTASTCCQVLINAGVMDELEAVITMDDWKDKHWRS